MYVCVSPDKCRNVTLAKKLDKLKVVYEARWKTALRLPFFIVKKKVNIVNEKENEHENVI